VAGKKTASLLTRRMPTSDSSRAFSGALSGRPRKLLPFLGGRTIYQTSTPGRNVADCRASGETGRHTLNRREDRTLPAHTCLALNTGLLGCCNFSPALICHLADAQQTSRLESGRRGKTAAARTCALTRLAFHTCGKRRGICPTTYPGFCPSGVFVLGLRGGGHWTLRHLFFSAARAWRTVAASTTKHLPDRISTGEEGGHTCCRCRLVTLFPCASSLATILSPVRLSSVWRTSDVWAERTACLHPVIYPFCHVQLGFFIQAAWRRAK